MFGFVRYLYLKALVSFSRLVARLVSPAPNPQPSSVLRVPSRDKHRAIKIHVYKPNLENKNPTPVLINFYGSGFILPFHGSDDYFCRHVANTTSHTVLDVEYRLSPEHPFPAAIHDVEDTIRYILDRPDEYGPSQISLSGFSSGGTLALAACTVFPRDTFRSLIAFYPATDLATDPGLRRAPAPGGKRHAPFWTRVFRESYIGDMDARDPRISPAFADAGDFPERMLIVTGELDTSALEAEELARKAMGEGRAVPSGSGVVLRRMKGCGHAFDKKMSEIAVKARDEVYGLAVDMLRSI